MRCIILAIIAVILVGILVGNILYVEFGWFHKFYHNVLNSHQPSDTMHFDGCSLCSKCKYCGKDIMQDSQGNWF